MTRSTNRRDRASGRECSAFVQRAWVLIFFGNSSSQLAELGGLRLASVSTNRSAPSKLPGNPFWAGESPTFPGVVQNFTNGKPSQRHPFPRAVDPAINPCQAATRLDVQIDLARQTFSSWISFGGSGRFPTLHASARSTFRFIKTLRIGSHAQRTLFWPPANSKGPIENPAAAGARGRVRNRRGAEHPREPGSLWGSHRKPL